MSYANLARQGYKTIQREMSSDKSTERLVFGKITSALQSVDLNAPTAIVDLASAVTQNTKLWNLLFIDLTHPDNQLPMALKQNLIGLAEFVQAHSIKVLAGKASHHVLIDINKSIIAGLSGVTKPVISLDHVEAA